MQCNKIVPFLIVIFIVLSTTNCSVYEKNNNVKAYIPVNTIQFSKSVGFTLPSINVPSLELRFNKIENLRNKGLMSGTLRITLQATKFKYNGAGLKGFIIATKRLGQLAGGKALIDGNYKIQYIEPNKKELYFITIALEEATSSDTWVIVDAVSIPNKKRNDTKFSIGRLSIAGSKSYFKNSQLYSIVKDYKVNKLQVRHIRKIDSSCKQGYQDHLQLNGPIDNDSTFVIKKLFSTKILPCERNNVKMAIEVYLNSSGGLLKDGFALGRLFKEYGVEAIIDGQKCSSSCAVAFLGAKFRKMFNSGTLLFHAPYYTNILENGSINSISCKNPSQSSKLLGYYKEMLGKDTGKILFNRTMDFCSNSDGWTINPDAAKLYKIIY